MYSCLLDYEWNTVLSLDHMGLQMYGKIIIIIARVVDKFCLPAQDVQGQIYDMMR